VIRARGSEIAANGIALRRVGKPADVAAVVHFLATSEPNFMTGQTLTVDGFQYQM
jgi:3-oxoacyl-[acyl-carrier protein] reductase